MINIKPVENIELEIKKVEEKPAIVEPVIEMEMQLVMKEEIAEPVIAPQPEPRVAAASEDFDDAEEQKRRAAERIQKLRNLSYNMNNTADANNEFDAVPAYVRRNMDLFGTALTSVENFYSKVTVSKDENNQTQISTINTFLDGKKPD